VFPAAGTRIIDPLLFDETLYITDSSSFQMKNEISRFLKKVNLLISFVFVGIVVVVINPTQPLLAQSQSCDSGIVGDRDGDDIPDVWETGAIDANADGKIDLDLAAREASPFHKDLFLEVDYMEFHQPYSAVIPSVVEAFRRAPVCNPDGIDGIRLHVQLDEQIPHQDSIPLTVNGIRTWNGFYDLKDQYFGTALERLDGNKDPLLLAKNNIYHYVMYAHTFDNRGNSGVSNGIPGMDFIVSLGKFAATDPITRHITGTSVEQAGTLMHELGHNLNLRHGGGDDTNCKPNYMSIMSYPRQFQTPLGNRPLDYSRSFIEPLNENNLDEFRGIGASDPERLLTTYGPQRSTVAPAGEPVDWNADLDTNDIGVNVDLNYVPACQRETPNDILNGYDDWDNLIYDIELHGENTGVSREGIENFNSNNSASLSNSTSMMTDDLLNISARGIDNEPSLNDELTREDVIRMNAGIILSIDDAIEEQLSSNDSMSALSEGGEPTNAEDVKTFYEDRLGTGESVESALSDEPLAANDTTILGSVVSDNLDQAIAGLNDLKSTVDSSFGFALSDDVITEPDAQLELNSKINNAISALESQTCTASNCEVVEKAANSTIEYG
jgi:hypothetical protein